MATIKTIAGGKLGWGGLIDRGDRFIPSYAASDCLNVYEEKGISSVLKKRKGYTKASGAFVLGGAYETTSTGSQAMDATHTKISQEILMSGTGSGADIDFTSGTVDIVIAASIQRGAAPANQAIKFTLFTVDASGHPDTLIGDAGRYIDPNTLTATEHWFYFPLNSIPLTTNHVCIVCEPSSNPSAEVVKWHFSNGGGGYAPGGARVSAYWDGAAWVDIAGTDFKFKLYYRTSTPAYKSIAQYADLFSLSEFVYNGTFVTDTQGIATYSPTEDKIDYSLFLEGESSGVNVISYSTAFCGINIFPLYTGPGGNIKFRALKSRLVFGSENYLFQSSFNSSPLRIAKFATANSSYRFANTTGGMLIAPNMNVPQIWGSTSYPISGYTGVAAFAGLTNPITLANTVMWHQQRAWWGRVIINGVAYPNRIYYSGLGTPEDGYSDTGYISTDSTTTAMVDKGDFAVLADMNDTYYFLGGGGTASGFERIKHSVPGGVAQQEALCAYSDESGFSAIYGWGNRGIFEIDRNNKRYISLNLYNKLDGLILSDISICPDYRRGLVLFSYTEAGTRKVLVYDVAKRTWWAEDISATQMISCNVPNKAIPQIYGIKNAELWAMYTGNEDDSTFIPAYYKCGPALAGDNLQFINQAAWLRYRNEPVMSHLDVKYANDYATEVFDSTMQRKTIRKTTFADNVPVLAKVNISGVCTSNEVKLYQAVISSTVSVNSNSGQTVLSVASTTGFLAGHKIRINDGGAREEVAVISSVGASSLTLTGNLTYTHAAADADVVSTYDESFAVSEVMLEVIEQVQVLEQDLG